MMRDDCRIAFVILNYKSPEDSISLIKNIEAQKWHKSVKIYIVENGSSDNSIEKLKDLNCKLDIELIVSDENLGFARGNNLGIQKALADGFEYIVASNSDISIDIQDDFLDIIDKIYKEDSKIAVIAPIVENLNGIQQNPFRKERFAVQEILKIKLFYLSGFDRMYYFFRVHIVYGLITYLSKRREQKKVERNDNKKPDESGYAYAPHGSFLVFTPAYFKHYEGFDKRTFLYCEEFILAERLRQYDLRCWFENSLKVIHRESQSTNQVTKNYKEKVKFTLKHTFASCRYFAKIVKIR